MGFTQRMSPAVGVPATFRNFLISNQRIWGQYSKAKHPHCCGSKGRLKLVLSFYYRWPHQQPDVILVSENKGTTAWQLLVTAGNACSDKPVLALQKELTYCQFLEGMEHTQKSRIPVFPQKGKHEQWNNSARLSGHQRHTIAFLKKKKGQESSSINFPQIIVSWFQAPSSNGRIFGSLQTHCQNLSGKTLSSFTVKFLSFCFFCSPTNC